MIGSDGFVGLVLLHFHKIFVSFNNFSFLQELVLESTVLSLALLVCVSYVSCTVRQLFIFPI